MSCQCCGSHRDRDVTVSVSRGVVNCGGIMREFVQETFTFQARIGEPQGWRIASSSQSCPCAQPSSTRRIRRCADSCRCHNRAATPHMLCPRCGQATPVNASRCTACGEPFVHSQVVPGSSRRTQQACLRAPFAARRSSPRRRWQATKPASPPPIPHTRGRSSWGSRSVPGTTSSRCSASAAWAPSTRHYCALRTRRKASPKTGRYPGQPST